MENTMSDMNEYTPELFELIDNEGNKKTFELIDAAELNGDKLIDAKDALLILRKAVGKIDKFPIEEK